MNERHGVNLNLKNLFVGVTVYCVVLGSIRLLVHLPSVLDGAVGTWWGHDTVFSKGYSEEGWDDVHVGMTAQEVESVLGKPLEKDVWGSDEEWSYSKSRGFGSYFKRDIFFIDRKVMEKDGSFWLD